FIRTPAIGLLGTECYTNLIYNVQLDEIYCLKFGISKFLSLAIVIGSGIVKIPQIIKIIHSKSARGLSLISFLLDSLGLVIIVSYNFRHDFPFSTYGSESFLLLIQNVIIITLIILSSRYPRAGILSMIAISTPVLLLGITLVPNSPIPGSLLQALLTLSIPLALSSKIPQILINFQKKSTGQLSSFLIFSSFLGCLARLFTTLTETGDLTLLINFGCGTILNVLEPPSSSRLNQPGTTTTSYQDRPSSSMELNELRKHSSSSSSLTPPSSKPPSSSTPTINLNS
ncbi:hypothetical protein PSHT_12656, partial [Puccinia striiformis]